MNHHCFWFTSSVRVSLRLVLASFPPSSLCSSLGLQHGTRLLVVFVPNGGQEWNDTGILASSGNKPKDFASITCTIDERYKTQVLVEVFCLSTTCVVSSTVRG